ncbi:hypothetical protein CRM22_008642, partial [Opisthorchis felineus]
MVLTSGSYKPQRERTDAADDLPTSVSERCVGGEISGMSRPSASQIHLRGSLTMLIRFYPSKIFSSCRRLTRCGHSFRETR